MLTLRDRLPATKEIQRLQSLLSSADDGSEALDAELAEAFAPRRNLLRKGGELFWRQELEDGPVFEAVPKYTRSLDAKLPHERAHDIKISGRHRTRWRAACDGIGTVDAATEVLARRLLALEIILASRVPGYKYLPDNPKHLTPPEETPATSGSKAENVQTDHRDLVISAMANEIKRLTPTGNTTNHPAIAPQTNSGGSSAEIRDDTAHTGHPRISDLLKEWERHATITPHSRATMRRTVSRFIDVNGDLPVRTIRRKHARELLLQLQLCPAVVPQKLKGQPIHILIEYGKRNQGVPKLNVQTLNLYINYMSMFFNWAMDLDHLESNPARGMSYRDKRPQAQKRLPYNIDDLKAIFERTPLYTGHNATFRTKPGPTITRDGKFWLPLLALFTGARLSELIQLRPDDLVRERGISFLDISKSTSVEKIKTVSSERIVPLHPELKRIGFEEYVYRKVRSGRSHIFHELGKAEGESLKVYGWSDSWRRIQKNGDFDHPKKSFHSFRHTFKDACRAADIREEIHDALTGHAQKERGRRYGSGFPLEVLADHVNRLEYPTLDLSHLHLNSARSD